MENKKDYKKLYLDLKKQFDRFVKHKRAHAKYCKTCREFYNEVLENTMAIKNTGRRDSLMRLWNTLWINHEDNFDIIALELDWDKLK